MSKSNRNYSDTPLWLPVAALEKKEDGAGTPRTPAKGSPPFAIPLGERVAKKLYLKAPGTPSGNSYIRFSNARKHA